ncbi:PREDICTED: uncharacterized protein LOC109174172 [Ipomoea nil]|uniref:uncharacterized protein LOC109174172 n=1 Tax=Ipomoea nil TaxID=35883 RepID=UPI000901E579|nr:PREDICTED: uncharacterized protein LOC109174172 [Ipomoea nil]
MDLLRAVIVGPQGTPYHDGLFIFDVLLPSTYPNTPPVVYYYSGGLRLNPNLYECGKVCLSFLNTWTGKDTEKWQPNTSTILQVLVSIQGLILNENPSQHLISLESEWSDHKYHLISIVKLEVMDYVDSYLVPNDTPKSNLLSLEEINVRITAKNMGMHVVMNYDESVGVEYVILGGKFSGLNIEYASNDGIVLTTLRGVYHSRSYISAILCCCEKLGWAANQRNTLMVAEIWLWMGLNQQNNNARIPQSLSWCYCVDSRVIQAGQMCAGSVEMELSPKAERSGPFRIFHSSIRHLNDLIPNKRGCEAVTNTSCHELKNGINCINSHRRQMLCPHIPHGEC